jgi:hypothetical protein
VRPEDSKEIVSETIEITESTMLERNSSGGSRMASKTLYTCDACGDKSKLYKDDPNDQELVRFPLWIGVTTDLPTQEKTIKFLQLCPKHASIALTIAAKMLSISDAQILKRELKI